MNGRATRRRPRRRPPTLRLGPILYARGVQGDRWRVSACILVEGEEEPPDMVADGVRLDVPPRFLQEWPATPARPRLSWWRYDFAVPRGAQDVRVGYGLKDEAERWYFQVPGTALRPRIAFVSCGGCENEAEIAEKGLSRNARWAHLLGRHRAEPFHLMLMGGDQVYADGLWRIPWLKRWKELPPARQAEETPPPELAAELDDHFLDTYRHGFGQAETAAMLASAPIVAMWDDHDIIDGWGSHPDRVQDSATFATLYEAARKAFRLFQLAAADEPPETVWGPPGTHTQGLIVNGVGILAPDLRAERRSDRVLSAESWAQMAEWLVRFHGCRHLLLMSSVPVVMPAFGLTERLVNWWPGEQAIEDDLRDQWRSIYHQEEWRDLVRHLAVFARAARCRVTVLSGEIHMGGVGVIRGRDFEMWQLISSGIVHPAPHGFAVDLLERAMRGREELFDGMSLEMPPHPATGKTLIRSRNWLSLVLEEDGTMRADWWPETGPAPLTLKLPALGPG
ncbi:MAG TPA: alkaline phosphatase D family protein [Azospirillaceae bacterium]|nr:alkaline phosphatase D family protein [Azospirillaceae bacterium]